MSPWLLAGILLLIAALVVQVLLPRIAEARIERRLAEHGGEAFVAIEALPSIRLLWRAGDRIVISGRRLRIGMSREGGGLAVLDRFRAVEIVLGEFTTGPFRISEFELTRQGSGPFLMRVEATTSAVSLADFGGEQIGMGMAQLLALLAKQAPLGGRPFPVSVEVELSSQSGLLEVTSGGGTIAGYPAGPLATMLAAAVARRLEIKY